jgi:hypothetical protein
MGFVKLAFDSEISFEEFVSYWSRFYIYPLDYLYTERIAKKQFTSDDVTKLFIWKNARVFSQRKQLTLDKINSKLGIVNELKRNFSLDTFSEEFVDISAIWKLYLLHIIVPQRFPIFDQHVCRAYNFVVQNEIKEIPSANSSKEGLYFESYVPFFNDVASEDISRKKMDEALWTFGKFLKTDYGKTIVSLLQNM